ncbi:MAG: hypothetical protein AB7J35_01950 [Dehalococcoidia bacterium]
MDFDDVVEVDDLELVAAFVVEVEGVAVARAATLSWERVPVSASSTV